MNERHTDIAALILRLALGIMFVAHGMLKLTVYTLPGTAQFFAQVGFSSWMAYPVTIFEIVGGVLLIAGVYSRYVAAVGLPVLLGAVMVHWGNGWVFSAANGGWEYPVFLAIVSMVIVLLGDGRFTLSSLIFQKTRTA